MNFRSQSLKTAAIAAACTAALVPMVRTFAARYSVMDHASTRSSHTGAVPRTGGIACAIGFTASALVSPHPSTTWLAQPLATASVGLLDDVTGGLPTPPRFLAQLAVGALTSASVGAAVPAGLLNAAVVNAVNFMDGINGVTALSMVVWGSHVAAMEDLSPHYRDLGLAVAGAALGFLPFNAPSGSIFLGDTGSYLFGSLAAMTLTRCVAEEPIRMLRAGAPLLVYAADVSSTLFTRAMAGEDIFAPHRRHVYQRLVDDTGMTHAATAGIVAGSAWITGRLVRQRLNPATAGLSTLVLAAYLQSPKIIEWIRQT